MRLQKPPVDSLITVASSQTVMMSSTILPSSLQMKENCTISQQGGTVVTTGQLDVHVQQQQHQQHLGPRLQPITNQAPCKENMGQAISHPMTRSRRLQQQQQLCELQCNEIEVLTDCISGSVVVGMDSLSVPSAHSHSGGHVVGCGTGSITVPLDHNSELTGSTTASYNSLIVTPSAMQAILPSKPLGFDYHCTTTSNSVASIPAGIQELQGGPFHVTLPHLPPTTVRGFPTTGGSVTFTPLPDLQWTHSADLWRRMRAKDVTIVAPETELRIHHPGILPSMRIILMDWMMEVCCMHITPILVL